MPKRHSRRWVTRGHAERLNREIHALKQQVADAVGQSQQLEGQLRRMGEDVGRAMTREAQSRHVAETALNGIQTIAHTVSVVEPRVLASTLFSLERDGRQQLARTQPPTLLTMNGTDDRKAAA